MMMRCKDHVIAIQFFSEVDNGLVLQCAKHEDIGILIRLTTKVLGQPDRVIGNTLYYNNKYIRVLPVVGENKIEEHREGTLFYIGYEDDSDLNYLALRGIIRDITQYGNIISLWKSVGVKPIDMFKYICEDGNAPEIAIGVLIKHKIISEKELS